MNVEFWLGVVYTSVAALGALLVLVWRIARRVQSREDLLFRTRDAVNELRKRAGLDSYDSTSPIDRKD